MTVCAELSGCRCACSKLGKTVLERVQDLADTESLPMFAAAKRASKAVSRGINEK